MEMVAPAAQARDGRDRPDARGEMLPAALLPHSEQCFKNPCKAQLRASHLRSNA